MLIKLLVGISLLGSWSVQAQDYVVTPKNDTIQGKADILTYDIYDRVEVKEGKKKVHFTAMQVKALVIKNEIYHTVRIEKGYRFLKLTSPGYVSRYLAQSTSGAYDIEYLVRRDGSAIQVPNFSFKKVMGNFLSDCSTIQKKIEKDELNRKKLDQLLREYNLCIENQTQTAVLTTPIVSAEDPLLIAIISLRSKLEMNPGFPSKKDALDLLGDLSGKVRNKQPVPNYLSEGLKDYLKDIPAYQADLDNIISLLKGK